MSRFYFKIKHMRKVILLFLIFSVFGCDEEEHSIILDVENASLVPVGQVHYEFSFETKARKDTLQCCIVTNGIRKNDTIKSITASVLKNSLTVYIDTSPNDFCLEESCWLVHNVYFDLIGVPYGIYDADICINSMHEKDIFFEFK